MKLQVNKLARILIPLILLAGLMSAFSLNASQPLLAQDEAQTACDGIKAAGGNCAGGETKVNNLIQDVVNILLFVVGIAAVISLIVGGIRYIVSGGDQQAVASAKNTVMYSIIGLIVAVLAWSLVNFVFRSL